MGGWGWGAGFTPNCALSVTRDVYTWIYVHVYRYVRFDWWDTLRRHFIHNSHLECRQGKVVLIAIRTPGSRQWSSLSQDDFRPLIWGQGTKQTDRRDSYCHSYLTLNRREIVHLLARSHTLKRSNTRVPYAFLKCTLDFVFVFPIQRASLPLPFTLPLRRDTTLYNYLFYHQKHTWWKRYRGSWGRLLSKGNVGLNK